MLWPLGVYCAAVLALVFAILGLSYILGERHREPAAEQPYEGGILSEGSAHVRLSAGFYLIAMFFVIFDVEGIFIFAWAIAAREAGWAGYWEILIFILLLVVGLVYLWRQGALSRAPLAPRGPGAGR